MDSQDPCIKAHFPSWFLLNELRRDEIPKLPRTYILRLAGAKSFGRLNGVSDILYIGSTDSTLRQRIYQMKHLGPTQWTNKRILQLLKRCQIEIARCCRPLQHLSLGEFEKRLLEDCQQDHDELPPLNGAVKRSRPFTTERP